METKLVLEYNALTYVVFYCNVYTIHCIYTCVTLRGRIKEAARTLRKQDPALPETML